MVNIISIDPGRDKCGLLVADVHRKIVVEAKVVKAYAVLELVNRWSIKYSPEKIIIGNGTTSKDWYLSIKENNIDSIEFVEEKNTTMRSKDRYFDICPPSLLIRWLPRSLILPPKNLDSVAALILVEDYFDIKLQWNGSISLKTWPE